jgi:hypothetical protein
MAENEWSCMAENAWLCLLKTCGYITLKNDRGGPTSSRPGDVRRTSDDAEREAERKRRPYPRSLDASGQRCE